MTQEDNIKLRVVDEESKCCSGRVDSGVRGGGESDTDVATTIAINGQQEGKSLVELVKANGGTATAAIVTTSVSCTSTRTHSVIHPPVDAPLCTNCKQIDLEFFDPSCPGCRQILVDPNTTIAQIMACMRQWVPQTQRNIDLLVDQVLRRGAHPNDRDGLTDLTLLHFACRAGASGVGDGSAAARAVVTLVSLGADVNLSCKWTHLSSLHYAAYFDASPIVHLLLETAPQIDINSICPGYDSGTALHIAASNLCLETARVLLRHGAKLTIKDSLGRTPKDCVPDVSHFENVLHVHEVISMLKRLLTMGDGGGGGSVRGKSRTMEPVSGRALLRSMGLSVGGRVLVAGMKSGTLRFCGTTEFAVGLWIGVELDTPDGKNDGSIHGVTYFKCRPNHGIFVPINKITKIGSPTLVRKSSVRFSTPSPQIRQHVKIDLSKVTSKIETGLSLTKWTSKSPENETQFGLFKIGDRVLVGGKRKATVRYYGQTKFASGYWYGLELDKGGGKNDGSVQGVRYFSCPQNCGIFSSPSRVTHLLTSSEDCISEIGSSGDGPGSGETRTLSNSPDPDFNGLRTTMNGHTKRSPLRMSFRIKSPNKSPRTATLRSVMSPNTSASSSLQNGRMDKFYLNEGVNVLVNNELGIVRYVGHVEFGDGVWIGVELRLPHGKNNGTVQGKQYFQCKTNHGLLVRPNKVTVHGLNGASLLPEHLLDSNGTTTTANETTKL